MELLVAQIAAAAVYAAVLSAAVTYFTRQRDTAGAVRLAVLGGLQLAVGIAVVVITAPPTI